MFQLRFGQSAIRFEELCDSAEDLRGISLRQVEGDPAMDRLVTPQEFLEQRQSLLEMEQSVFGPIVRLGLGQMLSRSAQLLWLDHGDICAAALAVLCVTRPD